MRSRFIRAAFVTLLLAASCAPASMQAQDSSFFFYRDLPYGSDAMYHPLAVFLHGGLDVLQSYASSTRASALPLRTGATSVWKSIAAPGPILNRYGWNRFLRQEVFPLSLDVRHAQWAPNYILHLIGGGMEYRKLSEWYQAHDVPMPMLAGAITAMSYHALNEIVENGPDVRPNVDAIADLLIFDPLGIVLFSFDDVARYFSDQWQMNNWSPQIAFSFAPFAFRNFGHSFVAKYRWSLSSSIQPFLLLGKSTLLGATLKFRDATSFSFGAGAMQTGVWETDATNGISTRTIHVGATAGLFYDRSNSLLASLLVSEYYLERLRVNIYPGVLNIGTFSPGVFLTMGDRGTLAIGITIHAVPFGVSAYMPR